MVTKARRGQAVRNVNRRFLADHAIKTLVHMILRQCIKCGSWFVEHNNRRIFVQCPGKRKLLALAAGKSYEFKFENVSFRYPESERYALKNLNLTLAAGERLAVVGLNGAGKSTFIKLLCGLYTPTEGRILLNGVDIRCWVGSILQQNFPFRIL